MFEQFISYVQEALAGNEFFQGGFILGGMALIVRYAGTVYHKIMGLFNYYTSIHVEMQDHCESFGWLARYTVDLFEKRNTGHFYLLNNEEIDEEINQGLVPFGSRWIKLGWCFVNVSLTKRDLENKGQGASVEYTLMLSFYGFGKKNQMSNIMAKARELYGPRETKLKIKKSYHDYWNSMGDLKSRCVSSIYSEKLQLIFDDLTQFEESREKYLEKGIPYRRGYLLHGPPGTGKTITAQAMANFLKRDLRILNLRQSTGLDSLMARNDSLIMIEDIDATGSNVKNREDDDNEETTLGPTLSQILNAIDGVTTGEDIIFIFTTNHIDQLDPALIRPGRIDMQVELTYLNQNEYSMACKNLFEKEPAGKVVDGLTPAELQRLYLLCQNDWAEFTERTTCQGT